MNKTVTANISGVVFHIESVAYDHLHNYLNTIRTYFHDSEGKDEIMADIEARIAELFKEALDEGKEVITTATVKHVISVMGEPEQYMDESDADDYREEPKRKSRDNAFYSKKLYRDPDDNLLGGVCSGIGHYFGIDKIWFRAAFLIAFFGFGFGFLLYFILWIIIPTAKTTAEKLEMKGEPINVDSIGNAIKDEFSNFKKKVDNSDVNAYRTKAESGIYKFFDFVSKLLVFLFKFILKVIAVFLVIAGVIGLITLFTVLLGGPFNMSINNQTIDAFWMNNVSDLFFTSGYMYTIGVIGVSLLTIIPLLGILYGGVRILFDIPKTNKAIGLSAVSLWVIGLIFVIIAASNTANEYSSKQKISENVVVEGLSSDTLTLSSMEGTYSTSKYNADEVFIEEDYIFTNDFSVDVVQGKAAEVVMLVDKTARGSNRRESGKRAENIEFKYEVNDNVLSMSPFIQFPVEDKYRNQDVQISIALPIGMSIYLEESSRDIIYDIKNVTNTYDGKMMGHHWLMTEKGLKCTDCSWIKEDEAVEDFEEELEETVLREALEAERELENALEELKKAEREIQEKIRRAKRNNN